MVEMIKYTAWKMEMKAKPWIRPDRDSGTRELVLIRQFNYELFTRC